MYHETMTTQLISCLQSSAIIEMRVPIMEIKICLIIYCKNFINLKGMHVDLVAG